ncbi:MAG: family 78 glycoside hydrolase catalytic domain [Kiritimatiellae bacterium]|nr:family 78 glycoside hydrolase catalytic domain [Kiritimatiellia bacterium]
MKKTVSSHRYVAMLLAATVLAAAGADMAKERAWRAKWIAYPYARDMGNFSRPVMPAPTFRKAFSLAHDVRRARLYVCGLGFFTCELDGMRVSDARLVPAPTQYDRRWRYRSFDLGRLAAGRHEISITAADGFYRASTPVYWHFEYASWTDYPKAIAEIEDADTGKLLEATDETWRVAFGPVLQTELRGGETYDARRELAPGNTDGMAWKQSRIVPGPGGVGEEETFPPCRVVTAYPMARLAGTNVWEAPFNVSGVPRIRVRGEAGAKVVLSCGEKQFKRGRNGSLVTNLVAYGGATSWGKDPGPRQRDVYILSGKGEESWAPEFTYHGLQCVEVKTEGRVEVLGMEALHVHTDFRRHGTFRTSDIRLTKIGEAAIRSCLNNFVGIPTDCPQREKNGWTSEARLMCETLLYAFDAAGAYRAFVDEIADAERPSGQLPGMLPTGGVGYNWGAGPAWDAAFLLIPESILAFTGDREAVLRHYPGMKRHVDYCGTLLDRSGLMTFGLGDWSPPHEFPRVPTEFVTTAFYVHSLDVAGRFADIVGSGADKAGFAACRARTVRALLEKYYVGGGKFRHASSVMPALALAFDLVPDADRTACAAELARIVEGNRARVDYGTIGSGCVLRELFENGYADLAFKVITQPEAPGYWNCFASWGMTTLPEDWHPELTGSMNHGAFADVAACMFRYLAGFRHSTARPGRRFVEVAPCFPSGLPDFAATHDGYEISWRRGRASIEVQLTVPPGNEAELRLPGCDPERLAAGTYTRHVPVRELATKGK